MPDAAHPNECHLVKNSLNGRQYIIVRIVLISLLCQVRTCLMGWVELPLRYRRRTRGRVAHLEQDLFAFETMVLRHWVGDLR